MRKIAAIDIGSNSLHMAVTAFHSDGSLVTIDSKKIPLQLVTKLGSDEELSPAMMAEVVSHLAQMKELAKSHHAKIFAVGTYALRLAKNSASLLEKIKKETGIDVEIVSGKEEARLTALGIQAALQLEGKPFFGVDIGGGSSELFLAEGENLIAARSLAVGSLDLRKHQKLADLTEIKQKDFEFLKQDLEKSLAEVGHLFSSYYASAIVYSGSIKAFAQMDNVDQGFAKLSTVNYYRFSVERIHSILEKIFEIGKIKRIEAKWDIEVGRVVPIVTSLIILNKISEVLGIKKWVLSSYGLREGLVLDKALNPHEKVIHVNFAEALLSLQKLFQVDVARANAVGFFAEKLFLGLMQAMRDDFSLDEGDIPLLKMASGLFEAGKMLGPSRFHRHSQYLIANCDFAFFSHHERVFISLVARFSRKGEAIYGSEDCRGFKEREVSRINTLAAILRVAIALCATKRDLIQDIVWERPALGKLCLVLKSKEDAELLDDENLKQGFLYLGQCLGQSISFAKVSP